MNPTIYGYTGSSGSIPSDQDYVEDDIRLLIPMTPTMSFRRLLLLIPYPLTTHMGQTVLSLIIILQMDYHLKRPFL